MFKGRDVIGKTIVSYDAGEKFDVVEDLIFDQNSNQLLGFLVQEAGWFRRAQVQPASDLQHRSARAMEAKQIQSALGRLVTRVILDKQDQVILNVGELITHRAIASARQAQVLDLLLNSVYTDSPQLSLDNLRAPQPGIAAL